MTISDSKAYNASYQKQVNLNVFALTLLVLDTSSPPVWDIGEP